jgi:formylglycine-generating enzyme
MSASRIHASRARAFCLFLVGSSLLLPGSGVRSQEGRPPPQIPALAPDDEERIGLPAEMRVAVLHLPTGADHEAALRRCQADDFGLEPLPEFHPHAAPAGPHYVDLGFLYFEGLDEPYRSLLAQMSREDATCAMLDVPEGTMVVRRMMEYAPGGRPAAEREAYRQRVGEAAVVEDLAAEVFAAAEGIEEGAGAAGPPELDMVAIAGGLAWLGSTDEDIDLRVEYFERYVAPHVGPPDREKYTDEVLRPLQVAPFWLDRTEVTVSQYRAFRVATGHEAGPHGEISEDWPVTEVNLRDAALYCRWRGKRLPTAVEWEFAARGTEGRRFPWGDDYPDGTRANFCDRRCARDWATPDHDDAHETLSNVGYYPAGATPEGLLDMAGNAREWCSDLLPDGRALVKGGGYHNAYDDMVSADVRANEWGLRAPDIGFRCAADTP